MKFLVDAQLPQRLSQFLNTNGFDSRHSLDLPKKNGSSDEEIIRIADQEKRIIISKDSDFLDNYILENKPKRLLIVSTGNINNDDLIHLFDSNITSLKSLFKSYSVIEIDEEEIQVHH